jgi:hypothetical protein
MKASRKRRNSIEIISYIHFNPLYRAVKRSIRKVSRIKAAIVS